jgi:hypothetical protein
MVLPHSGTLVSRGRRLGAGRTVQGLAFLLIVIGRIADGADNLWMDVSTRMNMTAGRTHTWQ